MGREDITPYWRVVRDDGSLNEKFPGGVEAQATRLKEEGYAIFYSPLLHCLLRGEIFCFDQ
jgi:alkylated DNA nucleotide flippase Atl1